MSDVLKTLKSKASILLKNPYVNALRGVPFPDMTGDNAQVEIARLLEQSDPKIIARVGETEGRAASFYLTNRSTLGPKRLTYPNELKSRLKLLAGYFPTTDDRIDDLARLYLRAIEAIDLYVAWTPHDSILKPANARTIRLVDLDPFFARNKWSLALEGRRVCIVSPFIGSIQRQFLIREKLFREPTIPDFELLLALSPMTHCEADVAGQSWIENMNHVTESVLKIGPEIAIIGAGAYGLPIARDLKLHGITSVVMGGSTQLLFGLKGKRWENDKQYKKLMNEYWKRPDDQERPPGFQNFEIKGRAIAFDLIFG
jgi:hypothetical protein